MQVGLKRIDAAVDALRPLGFSKDIVHKTVNALLKVISSPFLQFSFSFFFSAYFILFIEMMGFLFCRFMMETGFSSKRVLISFSLRLFWKSKKRQEE